MKKENQDVQKIREDVADMKKGCVYMGCGIMCFIMAIILGLASLFILGVA